MKSKTMICSTNKRKKKSPPFKFFHHKKNKNKNVKLVIYIMDFFHLYELRLLDNYNDVGGSQQDYHFNLPFNFPSSFTSII